MEPYQVLILILVIVVLLIILWYVSTMNHLRRLEVKVEESLSGIDVALTKRYDVLTKSLETTKGYAKHETETLQKIVNLRKTSISDLSLSEKSEIGKGLEKIASGINVIVENYPELKADKLFSNLQTLIADTEEHLQAARRFYNSNVSLINQAIVSWPTSMVARNKGITKKEFFEAEEAKKQDVKIQF